MHIKNTYFGHLKDHPMVVFWMGALIGAVIIELIFFYRLMTPENYESATLKVPKAKPVIQQQQMKKNSVIKILPDPTGGRQVLPDPTGGKSVLPDPTGG